MSSQAFRSRGKSRAWNMIALLVPPRMKTAGMGRCMGGPAQVMRWSQWPPQLSQVLPSLYPFVHPDACKVEVRFPRLTALLSCAAADGIARTIAWRNSDERDLAIVGRRAGAAHRQARAQLGGGGERTSGAHRCGQSYTERDREGARQGSPRGSS